MKSINNSTITATATNCTGTGSYSGLTMHDVNLAECSKVYEHLCDFITLRFIKADGTAKIALGTESLADEILNLRAKEQTDEVRLAIADKQAQIASITKDVNDAIKARKTFQWTQADRDLVDGLRESKCESDTIEVVREWADAYGLTVSDAFGVHMHKYTNTHADTNAKKLGETSRFVKNTGASKVLTRFYNELAEIACYDLNMLTAFRFKDESVGAFYAEMRRKTAEVEQIRAERKAEKARKAAEKAAKRAEREAAKAAKVAEDTKAE